MFISLNLILIFFDQVTYDVIHEFHEDNVKYLELRSTPREVPKTGMTRELYVEAVLRAISKCEAENLDIVVKLLLSIDRRNGISVGHETVKLAQKFQASDGERVVGVDLSGDPNVRFVCLFAWNFSSNLSIFHSSGNVPMTNDRLQI